MSDELVGKRYACLRAEEGLIHSTKFVVGDIYEVIDSHTTPSPVNLSYYLLKVEESEDFLQGETLMNTDIFVDYESLTDRQKFTFIMSGKI